MNYDLLKGLTYLNIPAFSDLYEPLNALQGLVLLIISDAEHAQLCLTLISALGIDHEASHERYVNGFPGIKVTDVNKAVFVISAQ